MKSTVWIAGVGLLAVGSVFGSVWDEALIAWRAPHDANGDGVLRVVKDAGFPKIKSVLFLK